VLSNLADWVTDVIDSLGYLGVAFLVALENIFPPIPSEIVLPFAGFVASDGDANLIGMIVAATIGSLIGALILYGVSAWVGPDRVGQIVIRYGRWLRLTTDDVVKAERWFDRYSNRAVLVCRCIPLIRSLISIPAGFRRMPVGQFVLYTTIGSAIWNTALIGAGYLLRSSWHDVEPVLSWFQYIVVAVIIVAFAWFVWSRRRPQVRT
jgi:membrane protein DedA with SNARE-associated domain